MMKDKSVLMFGPSFFGYTECIANEIRSMGAQVDLYDERPNNGAVCKTMLRYNVKLYRKIVMNYYRAVAEENKAKKYDYVFVIKSEAINREVFTMLKACFPQACFVLYLWDAVDNVPEGKQRIRLYDRVLTFDHEDAVKYGLVLRPLFFRDEYASQKTQTKQFDYDVAFIGTAHSIRPRIVKAVDDACRKEGRTCFSYLFLPHNLVFLYNKVLNPAYRGIRKREIHFDSMSAADIRRVYDNSRCILDVEHAAQRGLTMRTIEMVGMGKKLITTNAGIREYDFYDPSNICVIDRDNPVIPNEFWNCEYKPIPAEIIDRYSLRSFVTEILDVKE